MDSKVIITIERIKRELEKILEENPTFTGNIKINFFLGGVTNLTKTESFKIEE